MKSKRDSARNLPLALQEALPATSPGREATLALLAGPKSLFGYFRFRGG
jgi:hypothetical protein